MGNILFHQNIYRFASHIIGQLKHEVRYHQPGNGISVFGKRNIIIISKQRKTDSRTSSCGGVDIREMIIGRCHQTFAVLRPAYPDTIHVQHLLPYQRNNRSGQSNEACFLSRREESFDRLDYHKNCGKRQNYSYNCRSQHLCFTMTIRVILICGLLRYPGGGESSKRSYHISRVMYTVCNENLALEQETNKNFKSCQKQITDQTYPHCHKCLVCCLHS
ncbi:hypothetical protein D3C81_1542750 [compost metagenome]